MRDLSRDVSFLSINTATLKTLTLRQAVETLSRHGIGAIAPWRDRLAECGVTEAARILTDRGVIVTGLCRGGMFTSGDASDDNRRAVDEAAAIGAQCLVLVRACINTLAQANDLCDALGDGLGIAIDIYHTWWDPDLAAEIARAGKQTGRILAFHICDWLVPTRDLLLDRGMMGDGVIDIRRIRGWVEAAGYTGHCEVEIFSAENWWQRDPDEVMRICAERYRSCC